MDNTVPLNSNAKPVRFDRLTFRVTGAKKWNQKGAFFMFLESCSFDKFLYKKIVFLVATNVLIFAKEA